MKYPAGPTPSGATRKFLTIATIIFTAALSSCGTGDTPEGPPALAVSTMTVTPVSLPRRYAYAGTVGGRTRVTISTKLMGEVASVPVAEGTRVSAGQLLVSIRSGDLKAKQAQVEAGRAEAAAALANVSANYGRISELYAKKSATQKEMDDIQMAYDVARAKSTSVDQMAREISDLLRYADITSPIDGTIVGRHVDPGDLANPGAPLLEVEDTGELVVNFTVPESEIAAVRSGGAVSVTVDASGSGTPFPGVITKVNPSGDAGSRQYSVQARITTPDGARIRSGMFASVGFHSPGGDSEEGRTIAIPESLLVHRGQLDGVFIRTAAGEALLRWVRTGRAVGGGRVEILSGLAGGDEVITTTDPRISDGVRVGTAR